MLQVQVLLPVILKGLKSDHEEFRMATHFLLAQLFLKGTLQEKFVGDILERFVEV